MNGLMDDPWIRQKYEFWFARYPTGKGFVYNSRDLRHSLEKVRNTLDPSGSDPALDRMVLVGHSMGGVLSTLLSHDSGDHFWEMVWDAPIDELDLTPDDREELEDLFYFERLPFVDCVIYLGAPHQGSPLAARPIGRIGSRLVDLPTRTRERLKGISDRNQAHAKIRIDEQSFNSTSDLRPGSPPIEALQRLQKPSGVTFHNFAGNIERKGRAGSDGVVPLESASLESAETQMVVPAKHREIHSHPAVIRSVKQILRDHVASDHQSPRAAASSSRSTTSERGSASSIQ